MQANVDIVSIVGRAEEGMTRPFICQGNDGKQYYVKGKEATINGLRSELLAAQIALDLFLPIPRFAIVYVDEVMIKYSNFKDIDQLGCGLVWGMETVAFVNTIQYSQAQKIDEQLQNKILLFDWFIKNDDRSLGEDGLGNANLLWKWDTQQLIVIDHNLAFDDGFDVDHFWNWHIFRKNPIEVFTKDFRRENEPLLLSCISKIDEYFSAMPESWIMDDGFNRYRDNAKRKLLQVKDEPENFWRGMV
jgi:hypothetical protein